jgi:hypothetical protein
MLERINHELKVNYGTSGTFNQKSQSGGMPPQISLKRPSPITGNLIPGPGSSNSKPAAGLLPTPLNQLIGLDSEQPYTQYSMGNDTSLKQGPAMHQKKGPIRPKHQILTSKPKTSANTSGNSNMFTIRQHSNSVSRPRTVGATPSSDRLQQHQQGYYEAMTPATCTSKQPSGGSVRVRPSSF